MVQPGCRTRLGKVSSPSRRWLRLARLLVACLAFVLARPASAVPGAFDGIVLIAGASVPSDSERSATTDERAARTSGVSAPHALTRDLVLTGAARAFARLQSPRALIGRKYLRHCSLLC